MHGAGQNSSSMLNFLLTFTRIIIVTILIVYIGNLISFNPFSNHNREQLLQKGKCKEVFDGSAGSTSVDAQKGNSTRAPTS